MTSSDDLITTQEASDILKLTVSAISRMVTRGELDAAKKLPGRTGALLFQRSVVEQLRDERAEAEAASA